jgi:hypothetical protein
MPRQGTGAPIIIVTIASLGVIAALGSLGDDARGSPGNDPELLLVAKGRLVDAETAAEVFDTLIVESLSDPAALSAEDARRRVLVIDQSAFAEAPAEVLQQALRLGTPIVGLNVPYQELAAATRFDSALGEAGVSPGGAPPAERPANPGYYSYVAIFGPDAAGVIRTASGQHELTPAKQFRAHIINLGLLAKGLVIDRRDGGDTRPVEVLSTPPPGTSQ